MAFVEPKFSKSQVNKAGQILATPNSYSEEEQSWAGDVLSNWRGSHGYPINTFQATLRNKLEALDQKAIVAQRLKRTPSIVAKLRRFDGMKLARMQDIGGLRAVLSSVKQVRKLEANYRSTTFKHELIGSYDYIETPKADGYRSIHLIYRYRNASVPLYDGLSLELQIRTRLQHAWATAVETAGIFLQQALKSGQGENDWREFFTLAGAGLAVIEKTSPVPGYETLSRLEVFQRVADLTRRLQIIEKLQGFVLAADKITKSRGLGGYNLIVLDPANRTLAITPYAVSQLEKANEDYAYVEQQTKNGEPFEAVLVSAGPIDALKKAYPNYFLDTQEFVRKIEDMASEVKRGVIRKRTPAGPIEVLLKATEVLRAAIGDTIDLSTFVDSVYSEFATQVIDKIMVTKLADVKVTHHNAFAVSKMGTPIASKHGARVRAKTVTIHLDDAAKFRLGELSDEQLRSLMNS